MTDVLKWNDIQFWIAQSSKVLIKKLSRNDCAWADGADNGHQNGLYIPREIREAGFFPALSNSNTDKPHIFDTRFETLWPATGETKSSALKHYSNKGPETHFTRVPRNEFRELTPASWLLGGLLKEPVGNASYWFMVLDSALEEAELLESTLELDSDFHFEIFDPVRLQSSQLDDAEQLIEEIKKALVDGSLPEFMASVLLLPKPDDIAARARAVFLAGAGLQQLNPYELSHPGNAIMRISRDIEYSLYKRAELRRRATEVVRILIGGRDLVTSVVRGFPALDATFLSASQQRKNRAGLSFESHIAALLNAGRIRFEAQAVTGGRRPDFVLPNVKELNRGEARPFDAAMVLSLKTTLRERWKQVSMEKFNSALFLATVDDRVTSAAIGDMDRQGICLVVPESLKQSKETCYPDNGNVISFRDFFDEEVARRRPFLLLPLAG